MTHRNIKYPQPVCDNCGRFVPFQYGPNDFEWWSGGYCEKGKGCLKHLAPDRGRNHPFVAAQKEGE